MKQSAFRTWCREKWFEHLDELESLSLPKPLYNADAYFSKYKYWLKREFQFQGR